MNEDIDLAKYIDKNYMFLNGKFNLQRNSLSINQSKKRLLFLMCVITVLTLIVSSSVFLNTKSLQATIVNVCLSIIIGINVVVFTYFIIKVKITEKQRILKIMLYSYYAFFIMLLMIINWYLDMLANYFENMIGIVFILIILYLAFIIKNTYKNFNKEKSIKKLGKTNWSKLGVVILIAAALPVINSGLSNLNMTIGLTLGLPFGIYFIVQSLVQQFIVVHKYSDKINIEQFMLDNNLNTTEK